HPARPGRVQGRLSRQRLDLRAEYPVAAVLVGPEPIPVVRHGRHSSPSRAIRPDRRSAGAGDRWCRGVGPTARLLALDVVLDRLDVVPGPGDDGDQVAHRRDLLGLFLDEPLLQLIGGAVVLLAGGPGQLVTL